jgi:hypothetical protein
MKYTVRSLMEKLNMTYTHSYGVIRRMREKGLIEDIKKTDITGSFNAKQYRLLMDPVEFLKRRTSAEPITTTARRTFFNNPFNLKGAKDARYNMLSLFQLVLGGLCHVVVLYVGYTARRIAG